jgi:hypothetical protein
MQPASGATGMAAQLDCACPRRHANDSAPDISEEQAWRHQEYFVRVQDFSYEFPGTSKSVLAIILGGGAGSRLFPLTKKRAKPAVPLGGNYRLIDIPISNCLHSNINKMYCLTQFNSASLNRHLSLAYNANVGSMTSKGFVEILAATQTPEKEMWFQGACGSAQHSVGAVCYCSAAVCRPVWAWAPRLERACISLA